METIDQVCLDDVMALSLREFSTPEQIESLEAELLELPDNYEIPVKHLVHDGMYVREITLPKGAFCIGHAHNGDFVNIVTKGKCRVLIDGKVKDIVPSTFVSKGHDRKVGYISEDTTWITVHRIDLDSIEEIEAALFVKSESFKRWEAKRLQSKQDSITQ